MECFALPRAYFRTDVLWDRLGASTRRVERRAHTTAGASGVDWRPRGTGGEGSAKQRTNAAGGASLSHFEQRPRGTGGAGQIEQRARGSCSSRGARGSCWTERGAGSTGDAVDPTAAGERSSSLLYAGSRVKGLGSLLEGRANEQGAGNDGRRDRSARLLPATIGALAMTDDAVGPTAAGEHPSSLLFKGLRVKGLGSLLDGRASKRGAGNEGRRDRSARPLPAKNRGPGNGGRRG